MILGGELIEHAPIQALVEAFETAMNEVTEGFRLLESAQNRLAQSFDGNDYKFRTNRDRIGVGSQAALAIRDAVTREALKALIDRLGVTPLLSDKRRRNLDDQLAHGKLSDLPEITEEGLAGFVEGMAGNLGGYLAEAVKEVYDLLRPHRARDSGGYKTNSRWELGEKVILSMMVDRRSFHDGRKWSVSTYGQQYACAIDRVFHFLDGKPWTGQTTYWGELTDAISRAGDDGRGGRRRTSGSSASRTAIYT